jgi:hypothetical protein
LYKRGKTTGPTKDPIAPMLAVNPFAIVNLPYAKYHLVIKQPYIHIKFKKDKKKYFKYLWIQKEFLPMPHKRLFLTP